MIQKKYQRLADLIAASIRAGTYRPGDKLPTEGELVLAHNLSRQTVRQALEQLALDGLIEKIQGSGSYVTESPLTKKRSMRIAVMTTYISTYIFPSILRGIEEVVSARQYSMVLGATNNSVAKEREILEHFSRQSVDGIIVEGTKTALPNPNLSYYQNLAREGIPLVFINGYYPKLQNDAFEKTISVVTDDEKGGFDLTHALIKNGHKAIGGIFKSDDIQGIQRFSGYLEALTHNQIPVRDEHILWFNTETKASLPDLLERSRLLSECTALVCYNDEVAAQVFTAQKNGNQSLTAVSSFDGVISEPTEEIHFCSLCHPKEMLGRLAANKLFRLLDGHSEPSVVMDWQEN